MAEGKEKKTTLPWGLSEEVLKPNSVKGISQTKLKAFSLGRTNPLKKANPFLKKKEEREAKKKVEAKEAAQVFEQFVASFQEPSKGVKTFVRGSTINPTTGTETATTEAGAVYKPKSKFVKTENEEEDIVLKPSVAPITQKPPKKISDKKKSVLELFREELKRSHEERTDRHKQKQTTGGGTAPVDIPETVVESFKVDEYKELMKGSFDTGNPLTTNLYVGNISPKMNEELLCQHFGKFGPLASVKVMWPRTEEERARKRNCGFVAFMKRADAEKALNELNGATIMEYEIMVGWGKAVPLPPNPIYVPPDMEEEEKSKVPDPPSGFPFNAQSTRRKHGSGTRFPPDGTPENGFDEVLYNSIIRVVIPTEVRLLRLIHRMIEFVIREGPMFEAMIMNREINNPEFQFLFDNQSPSHVYYRWKLFSILNGDSPETWRVEEFRMFEGGSVWKPPPLKNLLAKVLPPVQEVVKKGQLSAKKRDELENLLRSISMEREKICTTMVWCMDNSESADEVVECISESLCIEETPLPLKVARLYLVNDILQNCSAHIPNASFFRRGFETKLAVIMEHFHSVFKAIPSRIRAEQFKRRVMSCLRAWEQMSVYHFNLVDKLRETFIGKSQEELEKQKAFDTVAALIQTAPSPPPLAAEPDIDGLPLVDNTPIDFSGGTSIDGMPLEPGLDGEPLVETGIDGVPLTKDDNIDGEPMECDKGTSGVAQVHSKWELVDYDEDSDEEDASGAGNSMQRGSGGANDNLIPNKEKQQLLAELDERKRRILREVELKVVELSDALEATGSYSKQEISEKVNKFREKLMQEAVEPKRSPPPQPTLRGSRSPSPSTLAKYDMGESLKVGQQQQQLPARLPEATQLSPEVPDRPRDQTPPPAPSKSVLSPPPNTSTSTRPKSPHKKKKQSNSPRKSRSRSPQKKPSSPRHKSKSPTKKRSRSRSRSPRQKGSSSPHSHAHKSSKKSKKRSQSRSPHRKSSSKKSKHHS